MMEKVVLRKQGCFVTCYTALIHLQNLVTVLAGLPPSLSLPLALPPHHDYV